MSRIKDLLAEVENIVDLKTDDEEIKKQAKFERDLLIKRYAEAVSNSAKGIASEDFIADSARYEVGDDDGHMCVFLENFTILCDDLAEEHLDALIEQNHIDMDDAMYRDVLDRASAILADFYADYESELCEDMAKDLKLDIKYGDIK